MLFGGGGYRRVGRERREGGGEAEEISMMMLVVESCFRVFYVFKDPASDWKCTSDEGIVYMKSLGVSSVARSGMD